jgi:acetyl-CoA carboxylase biotin carboxyl carrier protein
MDAQRMKTAIDTMAASDLHEMVLSHEGWTLRLVRQAGAAPAAARPAAAPVRGPRPAPVASVGPSGPSHIQAPMHGIVHLQAAPGQPPFVRAGDVLAAGQVVCTIEAMKVFNEVRCERAGQVLAVRVVTGAEVEAGQVLVEMGPPGDV